MRRINTSYAGDGMSCFWTRSEGFMRYHPDCDLETLHQLFGGDHYYSSGSGKTGAGFLLPGADQILMEFGYYRVDTGHGPGHQKKKPVGVTRLGKPIFGYVPVVNGGDPERVPPYRYVPVVLTDGGRVYFLPLHSSSEFGEVIDKWDDLPWHTEGKEITVPYITGTSRYQGEITYRLLSNGFYGVNALRFVDLRIPIGYAESLLDSERVSFRWESILSVFRLDSRIYVFDPLFGFITDVFINWPREVNGWAIRQLEGDRLFCWKQSSNYRVETMAVDLNTGEEYEAVFQAPVFDETKAESELLDKLSRKVQATKILSNYEKSSMETVRKILKDRPDMTITMEDSYQIGNCAPGTEEFMRKYRLESPITARELLEHDYFEAMIDNDAFRRVIASAKSRHDLEASKKAPARELEFSE